MRYLIDTHILLWASYDLRPQLSEHIISLLANNKHEVFVSIASLWELTIKSSLGKLTVDPSLFSNLELHNYKILPVAIAHLEILHDLPHHHKDPFDRLLIAQAMTEKLTLITSDKMLTPYDAKIILA